MPARHTSLDPRRRERITLSLAKHAAASTLRCELSSLVQVGADLWLGADEGATLERLTPQDGGYGAHTSFKLGDYLGLPSADDEIDVEGLDLADGWLWVVGSHGARRGRPDENDRPRAQLRALARVKRRGNRFLLARIPMRAADGDAARWSPADDGDAGDRRVAARLDAGPRGNALTRALRDDEHLAPFLRIPGKDNGFDVEGIAAAGDRVFVGLRGPVLRGWAVMLGLCPQSRAGDPATLRLRRIGRKGRRYDKHFLDLRGLGVREVCADGDDLLILAGPTMVLDGRAAVFRWRGGARARGDSIVGRDALVHVLELPYGVGEEGVEHPEGLALMRRADGRRGLVVAYDSPSAERLHGDDAVDLDFYPLE